MRDACSVDGCDIPIVGRGLCEKHYRRFMKYGDPQITSRLAPGTHIKCSVEGCDRPHLSLGFCNKHYSRFKKYGDPFKVKFEKADNGEPLKWIIEVALVFAGDECLPYPFALANGYGQVWVDGVKYGAHRFVCEKEHGPPPFEGVAAAHECGNSVCVNRRHLSWKTYTENEQDKFRHGTRGYGEDAPGSKLKIVDVRRIRELLAAKETHAAIAERFGVRRETISRIFQRKTWSMSP